MLQRIEAYCDAVPRSGARVEEHGPLRLFVADGVPWPYYARPAGGAAITADDVRAVRARQWELGAPEAFEWIAELAPELGPAARAAGLAVREVPLMALARPLDAPAVAGVRVRALEPDDLALAAARAVADLAFGGAAAGPAERDAALAGWPERRLVEVRERMAAGLTVTIVAEATGDDSPAPAAGADRAAAIGYDRAGPGDRGVLAVGSHQPVRDVTEIVGVGTLPSAQARGLGAAVTAALVADARRRGAELVFLAAGGDDVARMYGRLGFERIGTAGLTEAAVSS